MSKILSIFMFTTVLIVGISIGMYYGAINKEIKIKSEYKPIDSVQDIVIKNVQSEYKSGDTMEEVISRKEFISPYAKMVIEKKFTKCGHTTIKILDVPKELINLSEDEIKEKYSSWELRDFSAKEFTLFRTIDANCEDHYVIKENDGYIAVYNELTDEISNLVKKTDIMVESLREEDRTELIEGIKIYGQSELSSIMEDFES